LSEITGNCQVPGEPLAPLSGYLAASPVGAMSRRPRFSRPLMAAGAQRTSTRRTPSSAPLPPPISERSAVSPAYPVGRRDPHGCPCRDSSGPSHHPCRDGAGTPAGRHFYVRDPFRVAGEGPGATTHPRTPAPINVNLGAPGRYPGSASASMGSIFVFCLPLPSALLLLTGRA
jgi:hypothetical protein